MAKSARASSKKASKTRLRSTVHAPVEDARVQRLSEKLLLLASSSSANNANPTDMDLDEVPAEPATAESASMEDPQEGHVKGSMDLDQVPPRRSKRILNRKRSKGKSRLATTFAGLMKPRGVRVGKSRVVKGRKK